MAMASGGAMVGTGVPHLLQVQGTAPSNGSQKPAEDANGCKLDCRKLKPWKETSPLLLRAHPAIATSLAPPHLCSPEMG